MNSKLQTLMRGRDSTKPTLGTIVGVSENPDAFQGGVWPWGAFVFLKGRRLVDYLVVRPRGFEPLTYGFVDRGDTVDSINSSASVWRTWQDAHSLFGA